jgi:hypothetical protein
VEAKLFHVDSQIDRLTGMIKLIVTVYDFVNVPNNKPLKMHTQM